MGGLSGRTARRRLSGLLVALLVAVPTGSVLAAGPADPADGRGRSVDGAWTWIDLPARPDAPGTPAPPAIDPSPGTLTYTYRSLDDGTEAFELTLETDAGATLSCQREPGDPEEVGLGSWTVRGKTVSQGRCWLDHPSRTTTLPGAAHVRYRGNLTYDSCQRGETPELPGTVRDAVPGSPVPDEHPWLSPTCEASYAGNLQRYQGHGVYFVDQTVDDREPRTPVREERSEEPWEGDWRWEEAVVDVTGDDGALAGEGGRLDFRSVWFDDGDPAATVFTLTTSHSNLHVRCFAPAGTPGDEGTALLRAHGSDPVLRRGTCQLDPDVGPRTVSASVAFPAGTRACEPLLGPHRCGALPTFGLSHTIAGNGSFDAPIPADADRGGPP